MRALSVKQPWAWAIIHAGKDIENRPRRTHIRETIAIHASQRPAKDWEEHYPEGGPRVPPPEQWVLGAIIGFVDIVDCFSDSPSAWFCGPWGYALANARPLSEPVPCKGALGFWRVSDQVLQKSHALLLPGK